MPATVSICLPIYNGEQFLALAIESVLAQTNGDFELLIADDCSSDDSANLSLSYVKKDSRIKFWRNSSNIGLFQNYNQCLQKAEGKLIKPFAQDDILNSHCLERMVAVSNASPKASLITCARDWIDENGIVTKTVNPFKHNLELPGEEVILWHLIQICNWIGEPSVVLFHRNNIGTGFNTKYYHFGDLEYWFRILQNGNYVYINESLCSFRRHRDSASTTNNQELKFVPDLLRLGEQYFHYLERIGETRNHFQKRVAEFIAAQVDHLIRNKSLPPSQNNYLFNKTDDSAASEEASMKKTEEYKEALIYSSQYITELLHELDHLKRCRDGDHKNFERAIEQFKSTLSWKITAPFRAARSISKK